MKYALKLATGVTDDRVPHLSKRPSDLILTGTQEKSPIFRTVFNTLSHGVICFFASVSLKNH